MIYQVPAIVSAIAAVSEHEPTGGTSSSSSSRAQAKRQRARASHSFTSGRAVGSCVRRCREVSRDRSNYRPVVF